MATLPSDIILTEILPKSPAKSLLRFKCVSKSFKTQISCHEFINLHLHQGLSNNLNRFLILINDEDLICMDMNSPKSPWFTLNPCTDPGFLDPLQPFYDSTILMVGSCNGLLCICNASHSTPLSFFMLLNPCIGVSFVIPHFEQLIENFSSLISVNFGFGFDSFDNDYKIVSILDYETYNDEDLIHFIRRDVLVYSLNNANWRLVISTSCPKDSLENHQNGVLINNHQLHWKFSCSNNEYRIGCFDLESEKWVKDVPLPEYRQKRGTHFADLLFEYYRDDKDDELHLSVLDSCLCLLTENLNDKTFDVWVMKEYGVKESWVKLFGISDSFVDNNQKLCPLGYHGTAKNEILVMRVDKRNGAAELLFYNVQDKRVSRADQRLEFYGSNIIFTDACIFHGSLVGLPDGQQIGNWSNNGEKK